VIDAGLEPRDGAETHLAAFTELLTAKAGLRVDGDEPRVECRLEETTVAGRRRARGRVEPRGDAAIDEAIAVIGGPIDRWIEGPALHTRFGIQRDDAVERRGQIEGAVDDERRR